MIEPPNFPDSPGCYIFKDSEGRVIYVGKAKDLRKRVGSYFQKGDKGKKTENLVNAIVSAEFIATRTEVEALILENNLIKKYSPKYNIDLKDSRRYAYIQLTDEKFPRVMLARQRTGEGKFYGPFTSAKERDLVLETINNKFMLRTCRKFPKRACLRHHIRHCLAPCVGFASEGDYAKAVERAKKILKGSTGELASLLEAEMKESSAKLDFELASSLKGQLFSLKALQDRQATERQKKYDEDIIAFSVVGGKAHLLLFNVKSGLLLNKQEFEFDFYDGALSDFITSFYSENPIPKEIIVPEEMGNALEQFLSEKKGSLVKLTSPKAGEKKGLLELAKKNVELTFFLGKGRVGALKEALGLASLPSVIECFDISHLSGTLSVGSMVQFRDGEPDKRNYRRFRIKSFEGNDDFKAMEEVVGRRYARLVAEKAELPSLIVVDGGIGQLNSALAALAPLGLGIPVVSLAKRLEEIYLPHSGIPKSLDPKSPALLLLQEMRDEAHRFALSYNRLLRKKKIRE